MSLSRIGLSDHTPGITCPIAAVALGATVIEKHFSDDRTRVGPDHAVSIEPSQFKQMVEMIREVELALGDGIKKLQVSELPMEQFAVKSESMSDKQLQFAKIKEEVHEPTVAK